MTSLLGKLYTNMPGGGAPDTVSTSCVEEFDKSKSWAELQHIYDKESTSGGGAWKMMHKFNTAYAHTLRNTIKPMASMPLDESVIDCNLVYPGIVQGRIPRTREQLAILKRDFEITAVASLTQAWEWEQVSPQLSPQSFADEHLSQLFMPTPDFSCPSRANLEKAADFVSRVRSSGGCVYVHCNAGKSRSASVVVSYLIIHQQMTARDAYELVKSKRPQTTFGPWFSSFWVVLQQIEESVKASRALT